MVGRPAILAISGSLREHSYSRRIVQSAMSGARAAGAEVTFADLRRFPMPIYSPDDHERNGFDAHALLFQGLLTGHDGFLISSPEYNGSLPAVLKNAIDWASRPSGRYERDSVYRGKFAAIMTASPGSFGGVRSLAHLRGVLTSLGVNVLSREIAVPLVAEKFDGDSEQMRDANTKLSLEKLGESLVEVIRRTRGEAAAA